MKNRWIQLCAIILAVVSLCSLVSYAEVYWLRIRVSYGIRHFYGQEGLNPRNVIFGSSLAYDGLDWNRISEAVGGPVESWAIGGSSPAEWEQMQTRSPDADFAFVVVSPFDLNEFFFSDFRADVVPLWRSILDLRRSDADWQFSKRVLSLYPLSLGRLLFPTMGRSDGVLVGIRAKIQGFANASSGTEDLEAPKLDPRYAGCEAKISDWSAARLQRRLASMRSSCLSRHSFDSLKRLALERLLAHATQKGQVIIVVMPLSPAYREEFLTPDVRDAFDAAMADIGRRFPRLLTVRLDEISSFDGDDLFCDLVHLNIEGRKIATAALLSQMETAGIAK